MKAIIVSQEESLRIFRKYSKIYKKIIRNLKRKVCVMKKKTEKLKKIIERYRDKDVKFSNVVELNLLNENEMCHLFRLGMSLMQLRQSGCLTKNGLINKKGIKKTLGKIKNFPKDYKIVGMFMIPESFTGELIIYTATAKKREVNGIVPEAELTRHVHTGTSGRINEYLEIKLPQGEK